MHQPKLNKASQGSSEVSDCRYFRYKHMFYKKPTEEDFEKAQKVALEAALAQDFVSLCLYIV